MSEPKTDADYESLGYPPALDKETPAEAKEWKDEFENEYGGRPDDPALEYEREEDHKY